ncbi:hypothetical protein VFPPC_14735 [Pochonia chlamydosporia 170]|uniref:Uncharacterized protein n=1 Tax=Pochonia chlamydosporia 170 TaxID=1380566 RepID=A0A179F171_METCM|nr:hypothetical protein VFPPC_14735 [Pochonia chlamydosporia 170]OAQ59204.1 hypothetical protein VFPPC_14735 [Pochonia chlamydosporia 170]
MAPEQSSQTDPQTVSPIQSSVSPSTQPREPSPLVHPAQRASTTDTNSVQSPYGLYPQSYGSHYVPYDQTAPQQLRQMQQQQAPVNMPNGQQPVTYMTVPAPFQQPPESNKRKVTKDILHVIVIIICIIGMGFAFSLLGRSPYRNYSSSSRYYYYDDFDRYIPAMSAGPVFAVALVWSFVELIVRCSRNWKAGIHPGAHVGVCLCLWLGAVIVGSILAVYVTQPWDYGDCSSVSSSSSRYERCLRNQDPMMVGSTALVLILAFFEIVIFIIACTDTNIRNRWKRSVVIASTPYWAPPPQGWYVAPGQQPLQQQPQQQPQQQYMPMGHAPMTQVQPMMMAHTRAAPAPQEPQPTATEMGGNGKNPAQSEPAVREYYTPGTAQ